MIHKGAIGVNRQLLFLSGKVSTHSYRNHSDFILYLCCFRGLEPYLGFGLRLRISKNARRLCQNEPDNLRKDRNS